MSLLQPFGNGQLGRLDLSNLDFGQGREKMGQAQETGSAALEVRLNLPDCAEPSVAGMAIGVQGKVPGWAPDAMAFRLMCSEMFTERKSGPTVAALVWKVCSRRRS